MRNQLAILLLLLFPLSIGNLNLGQSNPLVIGLLLFAVTAVESEKWNLAALAVALAGMLKVYPLVLGLLLAAILPRRFAIRLALAVLACLLLPFFLQQPGYVAQQYRDWVQYVLCENRGHSGLASGLRDLRSLFQEYLVPLSRTAFLMIQMATLIALTAVCRWKYGSVGPRSHYWLWVLAGATCWMTVFGPATESNTYILLAPCVCLLLLLAWNNSWPDSIRRLVLVSYILLNAAQVAAWFPRDAIWTSWGHQLQPIASLFFVAAFTLLAITPLLFNASEPVTSVTVSAQKSGYEFASVMPLRVSLTDDTPPAPRFAAEQAPAKYNHP